MIRPRYLAVVNRSVAAREHQRSRALGLAAQNGMEMAFDRGNLFVMSQETAVPLLEPPSGLILGSLFCRGRRNRLSELGRDVQTMVVNSRGAHLVHTYWGGYLAFSVSEAGARIDILRAPFGDLPCYYVASEDEIVLSSDIALLAAYGILKPQFEAAALSRHLVAEDVRRPETCLSNLRELSGGQRLTADGDGIAVERIWSPWTFAAAERQICEPEEATAQVRDAVQHAVGVLARQTDHVVLRLSGGLDSSVVAAALAASGCSYTALNLTTHNPSGDERRYAECVSGALRVPLVTRMREVARVDVGRSDATRLPRPTARNFAQETRRITEEIAGQTGAGAALDGGGGDNVFCSLKSARPVTDCLINNRGCEHLWPTIRSIATLAEVSMFKVAHRAWTSKWRGSAAYRFPVDMRFLSDEAIAHAPGALNHPWLDAPQDALPGKAAHVSLVMTAQSVVEGFDPQDHLPLFSPLICQPVIEACLRIPSWLWFANGLNRAIARRAFADILPSQIVERRSKGTPDSFVIEIYEANRPKIRDMLLGGALSAASLIDCKTLALTLDDPRPVTGHDYFRVMRLVDVEAWARTL